MALPNATAASTTLASLSRFSTVDYAIFVILLLASLLVGTLSGWRSGKRDTKDFLTGGRTMNPVAVVLSLLGGVVSALSVLGNATEMYLYGTQLWLNLLGCIYGACFVISTLLPVLYPLGLATMNEYLQLRFDSPVLRKLGSLSQLVNSGFYLGICLYAPSLTLSSVTRLPMWAAIVSLGIICSVYISLVGSLCICDEGGIKKDCFDPNPLVRHTFWSVQVLGAYFFVSTIGISQPQYQRLVSVRTLRISQMLCVAFVIGLILLWSLFYLSGLVAYAAYDDCDPLGNGQIEKPDQILAFLVADKLHHLPGMTGVFVAAVAGAVLSSLSSQANAMVVLLWEDFLNGWWIFRDISHTKAKTITRVLSSCMGLLGIALAFLVANLGTLFQVGYSISGALVSPLDGLFVTGILAPWVNAKGALAGFVSALVFNLWLVIGKFVHGAGKSEELPLSTDGCLAEDVLLGGTVNGTGVLINGTDYVALTTTTTTTTAAPVNQLIEERDYIWLYDISYCYLGAVGILIVLTVSTVVSVITGFRGTVSVVQSEYN
ncbi:sodium-coupled monocarboxylate transporter 1-like [Penaeus indicus]|uniref:sodium-coupled monocarboxylate transporter 1-like n=1 Tax=Penaeus indicus TaxID=29960 RepID=UPI00300C7118